MRLANRILAVIAVVWLIAFDHGWAYVALGVVALACFARTELDRLRMRARA